MTWFNGLKKRQRIKGERFGQHIDAYASDKFMERFNLKPGKSFNDSLVNNLAIGQLIEQSPEAKKVIEEVNVLQKKLYSMVDVNDETWAQTYSEWPSDMTIVTRELDKGKNIVDAFKAVKEKYKHLIDKKDNEMQE